MSEIAVRRSYLPVRRVMAGWLAVGGLVVAVFLHVLTAALVWLVAVVLAVRWRRAGVIRQCAIVVVSILVVMVVLGSPLVSWQTRYSLLGCWALHGYTCELSRPW